MATEKDDEYYEDFELGLFEESDMRDLFGPPSVRVGVCIADDEEFRKTFIRLAFPPPGSPSEVVLNNVSIPLWFRAKVICMRGVPKDDKLPSSARTVLFEKKLKLPFGMYEKFVLDSSFRYKFITYVYEGQREALMKAGDCKCVCCGKFGPGFVWQLQSLQVPGNEEGLKLGVAIEFTSALPVCRGSLCNQVVREFSYKLNKVSEDDLTMQCGYERCGKVEQTGGPKFMRCGRCRIRFYCSKECQINDWPHHKKMCEARKDVKK